jgi:hypothetical protein
MLNRLNAYMDGISGGKERMHTHACILRELSQSHIGFRK